MNTTPAPRPLQQAIAIQAAEAAAAAPALAKSDAEHLVIQVPYWWGSRITHYESQVVERGELADFVQLHIESADVFHGVDEHGELVFETDGITWFVRYFADADADEVAAYVAEQQG